MIWIAIALVPLVTVVAIAIPVLNAQAPRNSSADHDLAVFADQMKEVERDKERNTISEAEYESARTEIGRRILSAERDAISGGPVRSPGSNFAVAVGVLLLVPLIAAPIYLLRGNPSLVGEIVTTQTGATASPGDAETRAGLQDSITRLKARLENAPDDFDGWVLLGRSYMVTQEPLLAISSYEKAIALRPEDGAIHSFLGEAIVFSSGGTVTETARAAFEKAIGVDGTDPAARFYLALASAQGGNLRGAFDAWLALAADTPLDAPWRGVLMQQLETAARDLNVDLAAVMPVSPGASSVQAARGPTNEDVEAAQEMSPQDRAQMIRGMVEQLAARLNDNPNDAEGWERLGRSYRVLGETSKAAEAEARARALPNSSDAGQTARLDRDQGKGEAPTGAGAEGAQQEMIEGMVAGLAARLDDDPQDREGWLRLTRSYQVLGKETLALESFEEAATHFPQDAELLQLFARAVVAQSSPDAPLSNRAFNLYRRVLEIQRDNAEALYFVGLGEAERENHEEARRLWSTLLESLAPDSNARNIVEERLRRLSTP